MDPRTRVQGARLWRQPERSWCEGSGALEPRTRGSRHLLYRLEGCRYQEKKASRGRWQERKREKGREAGRTGIADRTKADSLCQPGEVRLCPRPPHPPQSPSMPCLFQEQAPAPPRLAAGAQRPRVAGTPRGGIQGEETASPTGTSRCKKKKKNPTESCPFVWELLGPF